MYNGSIEQKKIVLRTHICLFLFFPQSSHCSPLRDSCLLRTHLLHRLHRIEQTHVRVIAKHVVKRMLTINQLQLVEFHVLGRLLELTFLCQYLLLKFSNELCILRAGRSLLIHGLLLKELLVEVTVLRIHEIACITKFGLKL